MIGGYKFCLIFATGGINCQADSTLQSSQFHYHHSEVRFLEFENTGILHRFKEDRYEN